MTNNEINSLPEKARQFIHDLVSFADPAGLVQTNFRLSEENEYLLKLVANIERETAEKVVELCWLHGDTGSAVVAIRNHFNLGETP